MNARIIQYGNQDMHYFFKGQLNAAGQFSLDLVSDTVCRCLADHPREVKVVAFDG